jgi:hypothetical protein
MARYTNNQPEGKINANNKPKGKTNANTGKVPQEFAKDIVGTKVSMICRRVKSSISHT